jgi:multiple sugar transport system permease protein
MALMDTSRSQASHSPGRLAAMAVLVLAALFFVTPVVSLLLIALTSQGQTVRWLANSALYSGSGVLIAVAFGIPAGYGLATTEFRGRRPLLVVTMVAMLIPSNALALPLFLEANAVHMLDSPFAVILPYGLFPFGVYISYLFFNTPRVHGLLAAARVDGATEWQAFRRVMLPLSTSVIALIVALDFVASWTNYFLPWVMYSAFNYTGRYPLALGIAQQLFPGSTAGDYYNLQLQTALPASDDAVLILVAAAPVLVILLIAQRWIVSGRMRGVFGGD